MLQNTEDRIKRKAFQRELNMAIETTMERYADASAQHFEEHFALKENSNYAANTNPTEACIKSIVNTAEKLSLKDILKNLIKKNSSVTIPSVKKISRSILNQFSKNGPNLIKLAGKKLAKQTYKLISGKITLEQYTQSIGKEGYLLASSTTGASIGAGIGSIVPGLGTAVGGFIGGMVASWLSGATYNQLMKVIQDAKLSEERLKIITEYCKKLKDDEIHYREEMIQRFNEFFDEKETMIRTGFEDISMSLVNGKSISSGLQKIADAFNVELAFSSREAFSEHLKKNRTLEI